MQHSAPFISPSSTAILLMMSYWWFTARVTVAGNPPVLSVFRFETAINSCSLNRADISVGVISIAVTQILY